MSYWGQDAISAYRGPDRRGADRTPPAIGLEYPRARFWGRAGWVAPGVGLVAFAASVFSAGGLTDVACIYASLHLCWCIAALAASAGLYLRWRLTGEATVGLLAAAFAVLSASQLPLSVADVASEPGDLTRSSYPLVQLAVLVPTAWLLFRCIREEPVDSSLRPARLTARYGGGALVAAVAITLLRHEGLLPPRVGVHAAFAVDLCAAGMAFAFAWAFASRARSVARPVSTRVAVAFVGFGAALLLRAFAREAWTPLWVLAEFVNVVAVVVVVLVAISLLQTVLDFHGLRMLALSLRASSAEETVRREQERMHELRSTVAGIRSASGTLRRYEDDLDPDRKQTIEQMMTAELARLERLLRSDDRLVAPGPVMLDEVMRPVVVSHREQGMTVHWRPSGSCVLIRADEVAEVLNILLTNAHRHAPGSVVEVDVEDLRDTVRVTVQDDGPGVPPEVRDRLFDRGARSLSSPGQGLGLHIAQRLAASQGGTLTVLDPVPGAGARFTLTLRSVAAIDGSHRIGQREYRGER